MCSCVSCVARRHGYLQERCACVCVYYVSFGETAVFAVKRVDGSVMVAVRGDEPAGNALMREAALRGVVRWAAR